VSQGFGGPRSLSSFSCTCICITNHFFSLTDTAASASAILLQQLAADPSCHPTRMRPQPHAPTHTSLVTRCTAGPPTPKPLRLMSLHVMLSPLSRELSAPWAPTWAGCTSAHHAKICLKQRSRSNAFLQERHSCTQGDTRHCWGGGGQGVWEWGGASRRHACKCIQGGLHSSICASCTHWVPLVGCLSSDGMRGSSRQP
jgi:hypothetical protein